MKVLFISTLIFYAAYCQSCKPHNVPDCNYALPEGFRLSQNKKGKWAILNNQNEVLGWSLRYGYYDFYTQELNGGDTYNDSCKGKGELKNYLNSKEMNNFR